MWAIANKLCRFVVTLGWRHQSWHTVYERNWREKKQKNCLVIRDNCKLRTSLQKGNTHRTDKLLSWTIVLSTALSTPPALLSILSCTNRVFMPRTKLQQWRRITKRAELACGSSDQTWRNQTPGTRLPEKQPQLRPNTHKNAKPKKATNNSDNSCYNSNYRQILVVIIIIIIINETTGRSC